MYNACQAMRKQPGYAILIALTITATALACVTLLPVEGPGKGAIGYSSVCSWAPWSTLVLAASAAVFCKLRSRLFKTR
jgi:hypothetical protein